MAQILDQALEVHGDQGLVLDDEDVGRDLGRQLAPGLLDEVAHPGSVGVEDFRGLVLREAFERHQEEGLARQPGDVGEAPLDRQLGVAGLARVVQIDGIPNLGEDPVKCDPWARRGLEGAAVGQDRLERRRHIGVARALPPRQRTRVPAQEWEVFGHRQRFGHWTLRARSPRPLCASTRALKKSFMGGNDMAAEAF
jgi:hypothetical protein